MRIHECQTSDATEKVEGRVDAAEPEREEVASPSSEV